MLEVQPRTSEFSFVHVLLEAAGGGPCIPLASRILKDRSKPWQGTARANSYMFHGGKYRNWDEVSMANVFSVLLCVMSHHPLPVVIY